MPERAEQGGAPFRLNVPERLDHAAARALFPIAGKRAYLNNASVAPMATPVIDAVNAFLRDVRDHGRRKYAQWEAHADRQIKGAIGGLIGASANEIAFVKNTTEGLINVANGLDWRPGDNVVLADIEYPSNVYCWLRLQRLGVELRWVKTRDGRATVSDYAAAIDRRTRVLTVSSVQFSNGYRSDLAGLSQLCKDRGVLLNIDAIQWIGPLALDLGQYHVHFLSAGGHKGLHAPIGTGFFYCRQDALNMLEPPNVGFHSVNKGMTDLDYALTYRADAGRFEEAIPNFPGLWGLHASVSMQLAFGSAAIESHVMALTDYAIDRLVEAGCTIVSPARPVERSSIVCFQHPDMDPEVLEARMNDAGVDVVVRSGAIRASTSYYNNRDDIDRLVDVIRS